LTEHSARESYPAFSPAGNLYFVRHIVGLELPTIEIVRREPDGTESVVHTEPGGLCVETELQLASDTEFLLSLNCGRGSVVLHGDSMTDATTSLETRLGAGCAYAAAPARASRRMAVLASVECLPHQNSSIMLLDSDDPRSVATERFSGAGIGSLDWSPDDRWLVFSSLAEGSAGLWLIEVDGAAAPVQLAPGGTQPAWRPSTRYE
jgi:hypothetical protein